MGNEEVDLVTVVKPQEKKSLLQKYDIPVEHLSYEYLDQCSNVKELERIVLILRSGEEGIFPDLIKHGEKCLAKISPLSKVLRVEQPVLTRAMLEPEDRKIIDEDIAKWMNEMQGREKDLEEGKALSLSLPIPQPEIRQTPEECLKKLPATRSKPVKQKSIASCDYSGWDKFDADAELDRIDLQDERKQVEAKKVQLKQKEKYEKAKRLSSHSIVNKLTLTGTELSVLAEQEKNIGNESYRAGDYEEALIRYDSSIKISASVNAYNNRAITNIKLQRYQDAVNDCNVVLSMQYDNVTALMRRGLALEHLEKNSEALIDYQTILQLEPNNKIAISAVNKLRKPCESKKVRMKIEEDVDNVTVKSQPINETKESNDIVKTAMTEICFCDRAAGYSRSPKPPPHYKSSYCLSLPGVNSEPKNRTLGHSKSQNSYFSDVKKSPKLIIEELPSEVQVSNNEMAKNNNNSKTAKKDTLKTKKNSDPENVATADKKKGKSEARVNVKQKFGASSGPKKIEVASKYEKPTSKISQIDNEKNILKDLESVESPYEFLHIWQSLKNDTDLSPHAKLLRSLAPEDLDTVIGNKLDGSMFSTILKCLERHFCTCENVALIHRYLTSLTKLSRFSIVHLFMDSHDKQVLENILSFVGEQISPDTADTLRKVYNL